MDSRGFSWRLLYTKPRAEVWAEINLRRQGFMTLLPRIRQRAQFSPLFPRYIFVGHEAGQRVASLTSTLGVQYVVRCGAEAARVPLAIIDEIRARMDAHGVVRLDETPRPNPLLARQQRERVYALERLVEAGFRVRLGR